MCVENFHENGINDGAALINKSVNEFSIDYAYIERTFAKTKSDRHRHKLTMLHLHN